MPNSILRYWATTITLLLFVSTADAQLTRTWVSEAGSDFNPCSRAAPCKTFAGAIAKTIAGGEVNAVDAGNYGIVTITKSITIDGGGTMASISAAGNTGIVVNAGATDVINLRNLSINGVGTGLDGVRFLTGGSLNIEKLVISGFNGDGINVSLNTRGNLNVDNVSINDCDGVGIRIAGSAPPLSATLNKAQVQRCSVGVNAHSNSVVSIRDSDFSSNSIGLSVTGGNTQVNIDNVRFANNSTGIRTSAGVSRFMNSTFFSNGTGINQAGGSICSLGDSRFGGNGTNGAFFGTSGVCSISTQ